MLTVLKVMCEKSLRKRITLPTNWIKRTDRYYAFTYVLNDETKLIQVDFDEDGAEFLKENGFIDSYSGGGKNLRMYCNKTFYVPGKKGEPVRWARSTTVNWEDIKILPADVIHFAAKLEFEQTGFILGLTQVKSKAKVISITKAA